MKEKHPIDSFFKDKLAERQYPMKEEYWASANSLIEANSARKRRKFLWFFLFLGLLGSTSLIGYWKYATEESSSMENSKWVITQAETKQTETEQEEYTFKENPQADKPQDLDKLAGSEPEDKSTLAINSPIEEPKPQILEEGSRTTVRRDKPPVSIPGNPTEIDKSLSRRKSLSQNQDPPMSDSPTKLLEDNSPESLKGSRVLDALSKELSPDIGSNPIEPQAIPRSAQTFKHISFNASLSQPAFLLVPVDLANSTFAQIPFIRSNRRHSLGLDFGFAVHDAMGSKSEQTQSLGMSPVLGLGYRFQINRNLFFQSGLRYTQTPSLAGDSTYTSTSFSFGAQVQGTRIRPLTLHQLELPISLRLQIGARSSLALGGYLRYLVNVRSEVSTFESNPFETSPGPVNKVWGYKQGFKKMDLGLQFAYYYQLSEGLHLGLETQYGLRDLRGNAFYREQNFDRNLNARIVLRYDFVRF